MDDVALIANNDEDLQKQMSITNRIANKYRIKFGKDQSKIVTKGKKNNHRYKLGEMEIEN
jgi:hypothetical protein